MSLVCNILSIKYFQVWDADSFSKDDFLGAITLDLTKFPRGARSAGLCSLDMLRTDGSVPTINLFKQKRTKGWWPFSAKNDSNEIMLQAGILIEMHNNIKDFFTGQG